MKKEEVKHKAKLSLISAISYFLKGNMIFALNGIVFSLIDSVASIFPPLFQQVYTDNIITQKSPEWFTPLMVRIYRQYHHTKEPGMVYPADGALCHAVPDRTDRMDYILCLTP